MRRADLVVSAILALFSVYLLFKSAELPIGWLPGEGPGGGAFPFWLSVIMLVSSVLIFLRTLIGASSEGRSKEIFMDSESRRLFFIVLFSLTALIGGIHVVGIYISIPLFMVFYIRFLGNHTWLISLTIGIVSPLLVFSLFEKVLIKLLPKGFTEPLFYVFFS